MSRLEDVKDNTLVRLRNQSEDAVRILATNWRGNNVLEIVFRDSSGKVKDQLLFRDDESEIEVLEEGLRFSFDQDGNMFRLVSEARRIKLAYHFDPFLAVHTSNLIPLPHQIVAVYKEMLTRQPLRFLLADDPGAGKTVMTGLLIKELIARGDLKRCLICVPSILVEQWQDELYQRFNLDFEIVSRQRIDESSSENLFGDLDLMICRMDQICRNEDLMAKLEQTDWDLVVVDEAHKMSAKFVSRGEIKRTKRYRLGELLGRVARNYLLLTATPHSGFDENFQLFMGLLDSDRFEGRFREGVHTADVSDMMRRMVKEKLYKFDQTPLFPERRAYSVKYTLSPAEADLYERVTAYVKEEMNRIFRVSKDGRKRVAIGFALTVLQRRLASSPEAIYKSLGNRRRKLERLHSDAKRAKQVGSLRTEVIKDFDEDEALYEWLEDADEEEIEKLEDQIYATAAQNLGELELEIQTLKKLESIANDVRRSGEDRKWKELSNLMQDNKNIRDKDGNWRKLIIFSEHKDTVEYLKQRLRTLIGRKESVVSITGSMRREVRRNTQERFKVDPEVAVLVATDAAGEGVNLQRANLLVNYDLPWNPNRIEQRFGRIHRIGQEEVCHMYNLIAENTREGDVFLRLFEKLEVARNALGGQVYDVLGKELNESSLRQLIMEAIQYGEQPEVLERLNQKLEDALDPEHIKDIIKQNALTDDAIDAAQVIDIKEELERAEARKLQPHFVASFFMRAFKMLGGRIHRRENGRFEVTNVPVKLRERDRLIGTRSALQPKYERITFERELISVRGKPLAVLVAPGHPLMDAVIDVILEKYRLLLKQGAVLVDTNPASRMRILFYLENTIADGNTDSHGQPRIISQKMQFVEMTKEGKMINAGTAPYLDYRNPTEEENESIKQLLEQEWLQADLESPAIDYAIQKIVPEHLEEMRSRRLPLLEKTETEVKKRLNSEINYWDHRALDLYEKERQGKHNRHLNSAKAKKRAAGLEERLQTRLRQIGRERNIHTEVPLVTGCALVIPETMLTPSGKFPEEPPMNARETERVEMLAMDAVMEAEKALGFKPRDVSDEYVGYDIESSNPETRDLRFIEVKGRVKGATTVTVSRNEILTGLNAPKRFILAVGIVDGESVSSLTYIRQPFDKEPDFDAHSVNYKLKPLLKKGGAPA